MKLILSSDVERFLRNSILTEQDLIDKMEKLSITEKDIEERMYGVFTYIPGDN